jgi:heat shock protein HslJ
MVKHYAIALTVIGTLIFFGCASNQLRISGTASDGILITPDLLNKITGIEWQLTKMTLNNKSIDLVENSKTTLTCDANGRVSGIATINRYSGNLKLQPDGVIVWSKAFIMTRMAGPPALMQQEADFTQALMKTSRMYLNESKLILCSQDRATVLGFEPAK